MIQKPAPLAESIEFRFWKSRRRDKAVVVSLSSYEGVNLVNVREYLVGTDGCMRPSTKGLAMAIRRLPELSNAVRKALVRARELGLVDDDTKADA